jgi:4-carboxymuconolactone decarboxylase
MDEASAHDVLRTRGREQMREILGEDYLAKRDATTSPFNAALRALSEEFAYASLWTRPGLDRQQRSLATLAMLCALNRPHELRMHLVAALRNGVTAEQVSELFTHSAAYCGIPAAIDALQIAEALLREQGHI